MAPGNATNASTAPTLLHAALDLAANGFPSSTLPSNFSITGTATGTTTTVNLLLMSTTLILLFLIGLSYRTQLVSHQLPPGPKPWPIVGNLPEMLLTNKPTFRWIHGLMHQMNTHILCLRLANVHVVAVSCPQLARDFLQNQDALCSSRPVVLASELATAGYLTTALSPLGEQWKKMRRVVASELLSPARHRWLHAKRTEEADHLVRYVYNKSQNTTGGGIVDVRVAANHFCGNLMRKMIFGKRFFGEGMADGGPGVEEEEHVQAAFAILEHLFAFSITDYIPWLRHRLDLDGHEKILRKAITSMRKYHDPEIDQRIGEWRSGSKKVQDDLLDVLIGLKDANANPLLSPEEIKAQTLELIMATVDNPSNAVEWALAEMLNQPEMLGIATEEVDRVVGKERLVQESDLSHLNYVKACIKEAMRLHPIAPFNIPRVSVDDTTVGGHFIPKGTHILLSRPGLGRNPDVWDEPLKFKPERHLRGNGSTVLLSDSELRMLSFSTGSRGCPGVMLGSTITIMLMARLLQAFTWTPPPAHPTVHLNESLYNLLRATPLHAHAVPRLPNRLYHSL